MGGTVDPGNRHLISRISAVETELVQLRRGFSEYRNPIEGSEYETENRAADIGGREDDQRQPPCDAQHHCAKDEIRIVLEGLRGETASLRSAAVSEKLEIIRLVERSHLSDQTKLRPVRHCKADLLPLVRSFPDPRRRRP